MGEKISVIIPVYNKAEYVSECVESFKAQTDDNFDIVIIDDGSTDDSPSICRELAESDERIRYYRTENGGAAAARNYGLNKAEGKYIAFADADDTVKPEYLAYLRNNLENSDAQISVCAHENVYPDRVTDETDGMKGSVRNAADVAGDAAKKAAGYIDSEVFGNGPSGSKLYYFSGNSALKELLYQRRFMSVPWGMLTDRKLWEQVRFPEGTEAEDMGTIYRLFAIADGVVYGEQKLYEYKQRRSNTMNSTICTRNAAYYKHSREMLKYIKTSFPAYYPAALSRHFSCCCQILAEMPEGEKPMVIAHVRDDISIMAPKIMKDSEASARNRSAASLALVSVDALKGSLKFYDKGRRLYLDL